MTRTPSKVTQKNVGSEPKTSTANASLKLGEYAYAIINAQYHNIVRREKKVLEDHDPEHLHHMRVSTRRLRTALQVFAPAVDLPRPASACRIRAIARVLGALRDLDVQLADLKNTYRPHLPETEQAVLDEVIGALNRERQGAFAAMSDFLKRSRYQDLKDAYETWLKHPRYQPLADLPLDVVMPDLLSPLLAHLLLHPGWLVSDVENFQSAEMLHDLRKVCKHVRYQAEFFSDFYSPNFKQWIDEVRDIQDVLGKLQDTHVLQELLSKYLPKRAKLPTLRKVIEENQATAIAQWKEHRPKYLKADYRSDLRQLLINPVV